MPEQNLHITASSHLIGRMNSVTPWLKSCLRKELKGHSKKITVAHIFHTQDFAYTQTFKSMLIDFPEKHISQYAQYKYSSLPFTRQRYKSFRSTSSVSLPCRMPLSNQLHCLFATHTDLQCKGWLCIELYGQVKRGGVDRASSSDARGSGFEPWPLHLKKYHFFNLKP